MNHVMSPTGVAILLLLALVVDYMSVGPNSIRDRLAFLLGLVAIRQGFNGSPLDNWTVGALTGAINQLKGMAGNAYIAGAITQVVLSAVVGILAIYTVGALLPDKMQTKLGAFAKISFPPSATHRINYKLWLMAILLGLLADLPGGVVGGILNGAISALTEIFQPLPNFLFGA
ncbi:hypothetical protein ACWKSP_26660 [Micromonosporaceae bacterium Da 78-11]